VNVGQSDRAIGLRFKEHIRYIGSNHSTSAYTAHILDNRHVCGTKEGTLELLKKCQKGKYMDCWEALYMQTFQQKKTLIDEQQIGDANPLFEFDSTLYLTPTVLSLTHSTIRFTTYTCYTVRRLRK